MGAGGELGILTVWQRCVVTVPCQPTHYYWGARGCALPHCYSHLCLSERRCVHVLFSPLVSLKALQAIGQILPLSCASSGFIPLKEQLWAGQDPHHLPPQPLRSRAALCCVPCVGPCSYVQHSWVATSQQEPGVLSQPWCHSLLSKETPRPGSSAAAGEVSCEGP